MNVFEDGLRCGKFLAAYCQKCDQVSWPPNDFCSSCLELVSWRQVKEPGKIIEYSAKDGQIFCIAEFEGKIRIMGAILSCQDVQVGQNVYLERCGMDGSPTFVFKTGL